MSDSNYSEKWRAARNILCVRLDAMGDVLMTGPAIRAVKGGNAARRLTLLTSASGAVAARLLPGIDETIVYDAPWMKATGERAGSAPDLSMIERLRAARFDAAVIFTVYSQNPLPAALLCYLAGIPRRAAHCRENPYRLLTNWAREIEPESVVRHEVRRQLDLVGAIGFETGDERMRVEISERAKTRVDALLRRAGIDGGSRGWLAMHAGATAASRRYPPELFARAARILTARGLRIVFTGTAEESALIEAIRGAVGAEKTVSLAGELDFEELAALVGCAPVLVSNNSSPVHLASALRTPVVDLYALTNPQHTPWMTPSRVLFHETGCRFCYKSVCPETHHDCLRRVAPEAVARAALELLAASETSLHAFREAEAFESNIFAASIQPDAAI